MTTSLTWRCLACDEHFANWWLAEHHVDNICDAGKLELIWPTRTCVCTLHDRIRDGDHPERCYRCAGTIHD